MSKYKQNKFDAMTKEFKENIENIKKLFSDISDSEKIYLTIIELGRKLKPMNKDFLLPINKVDGCQSTTYLHCIFDAGVLYFYAQSDALISSGLAALLILAYDGQPPEVIINNKPEFLSELNIHSSLSPNRANGLLQMYQKMREDALKYLTN